MGEGWYMVLYGGSPVEAGKIYQQERLLQPIGTVAIYIAHSTVYSIIVSIKLHRRIVAYT